MKNIFTTLILGFSFISLSAQVAIETTEVRGDGIMDFPANATKGILLPKVDDTANLPAAASDGGAIAFNLAENRIEFFNTKDGVNAWVPMTAKSNILVTENEHSGSQSFTETDADGIIIEDGTHANDDRVAVLKLSSTSKALILPQVDDATELPSPKPGTICYDMASDSIAVFNGSEWSFWN